jgi:HK97 family phage portal protein
MLNALRKIFTGGRTKALQPVGHTGNPWGSLAQGFSPVNATVAENLAGVASCINLISGTLASLPAVVWIKQGERRVAASSHPLTRIIRDGSNGLTWAEIIEAWVGDTLLHGNGLLKIETDGAGRLSGLQYVPWGSVSWQENSSGRLTYTWNKTGGARETLLPDEVVHLRDRLDPANPQLGKSRIARSPGVIQQANLIQSTQQSFNGNLARPGGVLQSPGRVSPELAARLKEDWDLNFANRKAGKTAVLGEGLEWKPTNTQDAVAAELNAQLLWSLQESARIYGVPPQLIGDLSASTFTNSTQAARSLAVFTLAPFADKIDGAFRRAVLSSPFEFSLDLSELLRGDVQAYTQSLTLLRNSAIISANEARTQLGFDRSTQEGSDDLEAVQHSASGGSTGDTGDQPATGKKIALVK